MMSLFPSMPTVSIIGAGNVGATIAYSLILEQVCSDVVLVDVDTERCQAQVWDIQDVAFLHDSRIRAGTFKEAGQGDIIVITAGAKQEPNEPRTNLIDRNYLILQETMEKMKPLNPNAVMMVVSNPVDILTFLAQKVSGLPTEQVIGSGTFLDSSRLRGYLSESLGVARTSVHAYVLGEHGDSQFVNWSSSHISSVPLLEFPGAKKLDMERVAHFTARKAYHIIGGKGSTYYGIGGCAANLCNSILNNTKQIRPVSHFVPKFGVCISLPAILCKSGILGTIPMKFNQQEEAKLLAGVQSLKGILKRYSFD
jgi:L-lactate dehydrogenase